jgi:hypothetical protein
MQWHCSSHPETALANEAGAGPFRVVFGEAKDFLEIGAQMG